MAVSMAVLIKAVMKAVMELYTAGGFMDVHDLTHHTKYVYCTSVLGVAWKLVKSRGGVQDAMPSPWNPTKAYGRANTPSIEVP